MNATLEECEAFVIFPFTQAGQRLSSVLYFRFGNPLTIPFTVNVVRFLKFMCDKRRCHNHATSIEAFAIKHTFGDRFRSERLIV